MTIGPPARILWMKGDEVVKDQKWAIHSYDAKVSLSMAAKEMKITEEMAEAAKLLAEVAVTSKKHDCSFDVDGKRVTVIASIEMLPRRDKDEGK
jgi:hypothetical protein